MEYKKLANGYEIPSICFGTDLVSFDFYSINKTKQLIKRSIASAKYVVKEVLHKDNRKYKRDKGVINCCEHAIEYGCNFFDTSRAYMASERMIGQALSSIPRDKYYICTKIDNHSQLHNKPAREVVIESMKELNTDYIDVLLLHWPVEGKYLDYWKQLEELYKEGLVKAIGVSNCKIHHLEDIKRVAEIMPMINEIELHPLLTEVELRDYCEKNNIQLMAYTSTARLDFRLKASRRMQQVCQETGKDLSQVMLRWHIQNGIIPIFNTSTLSHFKENMDIFNFKLTNEQMKIIDSMNINSRTRYDSDNCEWDRL